MRRILFLIIAGIVAVLLIILFLIFQLFKAGEQPNPSSQLQNPTPLPANGEQKSVITPPAVKYNNAKTDELVQKAKTRQPLTSTGLSARSKILASLNNKSGTPYSSNNVIIEYTLAPDLFQGQILTPSIDAAKQEAVSWMISQGFTKADICNLPFSFYLSPAVMQQLRSSNIVFNPLPPSC